MRHTLILVFLAALAFALFAPSLGGEFIMDDWGYITHNPWITTTVTPFHFWTTFDQVDFWPLTYTYYWAAYRLFGEQPFYYHVINVLLHVMNAWLVMQLAARLKLRWPLFAAVLFLAHPLHTQAVSWIVQFKTLFSTALAMECTLLYLEFALTKRKMFWVLSLFAFTLSLLAKTSALFLPVIFFFLPAAVEEGRKRPVRYLVPYFTIAALGGLTTVWINSVNMAGQSAAAFQMPWFERPFLMAQNLMFYFGSFLYPQPLAFMYPARLPSIVNINSWLSVAAVIGLVMIAVRHFSRRNQGLAAGYFLLLLPALGAVTIPNMKLSLVADHWAYLPDTYLAILTVALAEAIPWHAVRVATAALILPLSLITFRHAKTFYSEEAFWRNAQAVNPQSAVPAYNLGVVFDRRNQIALALEQYERAVAIDQAHARAWYNLGRAYSLSGRLDEARTSLERAVAIDPSAESFMALVKVQTALRLNTSAIQTLVQAVQRYPANAELSAWLKHLLSN